MQSLSSTKHTRRGWVIMNLARSVFSFISICCTASMRTCRRQINDEGKTFVNRWGAALGVTFFFGFFIGALPPRSKQRYGKRDKCYLYLLFFLSFIPYFSFLHRTQIVVLTAKDEMHLLYYTALLPVVVAPRTSTI